MTKKQCEGVDCQHSETTRVLSGTHSPFSYYIHAERPCTGLIPSSVGSYSTFTNCLSQSIAYTAGLGYCFKKTKDFCCCFIRSSHSGQVLMENTGFTAAFLRFGFKHSFTIDLTFHKYY